MTHRKNKNWSWGNLFGPYRPWRTGGSFVLSLDLVILIWVSFYNDNGGSVRFAAARTAKSFEVEVLDLKINWKKPKSFLFDSYFLIVPVEMSMCTESEIRCESCPGWCYRLCFQPITDYLTVNFSQDEVLVDSQSETAAAFTHEKLSIRTVGHISGTE